MNDSTFERRCDGITRRDALHIGGLSALGLTLADWFHLRAQAATTAAPTARSCILVWLDGGPSHLETFDLKPDAPQEVRGPFQPIATNVNGISISEHLPRTAAIMNRIALVRSMTSTLGEHNFASHYLLTGYKPSPALTYPSMPSVMSHFHRQSQAIPDNVAIGRPNGAARQGYLDSACAPFVIEGDPARAGFQVQDLSPSVSLDFQRMDRRRSFRDAIDRLGKSAEREQNHGSESSTDPAFEQAFRLIGSQQARDAFELDREPDPLRGRYGRHSLGQRCLLARRLIEAGTRFVTVTDRGWDTHQELDLRLREGFTGGTAGKLPKLDTAVSGLISDLEDRGMLDETLVVVMGEFGRTPKLNPRGGRDHWPRAFSVALAGGGIQGGQVVGQSDRHGEQPADRPVSPADLVRTILHTLGIDADRELYTRDGRPVQVNRDGKLVSELVG